MLDGETKIFLLGGFNQKFDESCSANDHHRRILEQMDEEPLGETLQTFQSSEIPS